MRRFCASHVWNTVRVCGIVGAGGGRRGTPDVEVMNAWQRKKRKFFACAFGVE